nr:MAG TPA: hypothetical protein [Bacteriophage sp.]
MKRVQILNRVRIEMGMGVLLDLLAIVLRQFGYIYSISTR